MKTYLTRFFTMLMILASISACGDQNNIENELLKVDREFSKYSIENGMNEAFYMYAAENAVMLRDNAMPLLGREKIKDLFSGDDSKVQFSWEPISAKAAQSGDMGYTYGTYQFQTPDTVMKGTYVSIWEKDESGNWKFVLDSGNEGLGE